MQLNSIMLKGWRNYKEEKVNFPSGISLLLGKNGQGKTNLLEALCFLSRGLSPRTAKNEELINWQSKYFYLKGAMGPEGKNRTIEIGGARDGRRAYKVDGIPRPRLAEVSGVLNTVFFMPEDLFLVKGGPVNRRRFLDLELSQASKTYRSALGNYKKYLRERNALLKSRVQDTILFQVLTEKLAEFAGPIAAQRADFLQKLSILARLNHRKLSANDEELNLQYCGSIAPGLSQQTILSKYAELRPAELKYRTTLLGPHRDDFIFSLNGAELKSYGSQGQQRTAVLSVKLAEIELIKAETGAFPLLLLDDVFSELDEERKAMLLDYLTNRVQTIIASTEPLPPQPGVKQFLVEAGKVKERD